MKIKLRERKMSFYFSSVADSLSSQGSESFAALQQIIFAQKTVFEGECVSCCAIERVCQ